MAQSEPPLRELLEARINACETQCMLRIQTLTDAVAKSERMLDIRLEGMNQIREQLATQRSVFATIERFEGFKSEYRAAHETLERRFETEVETLKQLHNADLKELRTALETQAKQISSLTARVTLLIAGASLVMGLLVFTLGLLIQHVGGL